MLDKKIIDPILEKYPLLEIVLQAGVVSIKMVREMLGVDRWFMQDEIYPKLILARAVQGVSSSTFKASPEMLAYLKERNGDAKEVECNE